LERDIEPCTDCPDLEWIEVPGGTFQMGEPTLGWELHQVTVPTFWMTRVEVTVEQYEECFEADDACSVRPRPDSGWCTYNAGDADLPMNCISHNSARDFAVWIHARLPTEAEWEFAARNGSHNDRYPWGNEESDCNRSRTAACGTISQTPCEARSGVNDLGICDLMGNLAEWVADDYHDSYEGAPNDGSAWLAPTDLGCDPYCAHPAKIIKGSSYAYSESISVGTKGMGYPSKSYGNVGFRLVRDTPP
jgi:formylglycine-generating enzyme required for sulfatase activity